MLVFIRIAAAQTGVPRPDWLGPYMDAVGNYVDLRSVHAIEEAIEAEQEIPVEALQAVMNSRLGAALYEPEGKVQEWKNYEKMIKDGLKDLHWHQWREEEVT